MTDEAIIEAEYVEWKMVKTRSTLQLVFEVPLELQEFVMSALKPPLPGKSNRVAIFPLREGAVRLPPVTIEHQPEPEPELRRPAKLAQIAGIMCSEGAFQKWCGAKSAEEAAQYVRDRCNVGSRADLDTHEDAAAVFRDMKGEYEFWMRDAA